MTFETASKTSKSFVEVIPSNSLASFLAVSAILLSGCTADPTKQLEKAAKDWSLAIRASQVIPVYPLSEDIQPGDVFLVPVSISQQTSIYKKKGFLPTDQLVTRLSGLDYSDFYKDAYWKSTYGRQPLERPSLENPNVKAPRAAFPSYTFTVDRASGAQLALPVQGIPFGLGLMDASRAVGTVTLSNAYTYGASGSEIYAALLEWYRSSDVIKKTFEAMANSTDSEIYLRVVTRVYLVSAVDVSLANLTSTSGGLDAGKAQEIKLLDLLVSENSSRAKAVIEARNTALNALSAALNTSAAPAPGGSVRLTSADRRSVSMKQTFDRPLVIGFVGFDVKLLMDGRLSTPIPSFTVLSGEAKSDVFGSIVFTDDDSLSRAYLAWLRQSGNRKKMIQFLSGEGVQVDPADVAYNAAHRLLLVRAKLHFGF